MNVNVEVLEGEIRSKGMRNEEFAKALGMDASTYYRKRRACFSGLTVGQMHKAAEVLSLTPARAVEIFLS